MEELRQVAFICAGRAFGFAGLAIAVTMVGFSYDLLLALKSGGILFLILALAFAIKAQNATRKDYRRTELWSVLPPDRRPPPEHAQWAAATVLREAYTGFAERAAIVGVGLCAVAVLVTVVRAVT